MIRLDATNRSLEVLLSATVATSSLPVVACYSTRNVSTYNGGTTLATVSSGTAVTILPSPGSSEVRDLDYLSIRNNDTVTASTVVRYNDATTTYQVLNTELASGDHLTYTHAGGWNVVDVSGHAKSSVDLSIGQSVTGGTANRILYIASGPALQQSDNLQFDGTTVTAHTLTVSTGNMTVSAGGLTVNGASGISVPRASSFIGLSLSDNLTNATNKSSRIVLNHYTNAEETLLLFWVLSLAASNEILIGGGTASHNAATLIDFYTAANNTTLTGTRRGGFNSSGNFDLTGNLTVSGNTVSGSGAGTLRADGGLRIGADSTNNLLDDASNGAGTATIYIGNQSITTSSDVRLKRDIEPTKRDALRIANALKIVDFYRNDPSDTSLWNRNSRGKQTGIVAQQAVAVVPWLVNAPDRFCKACLAGQPCEQHPSSWHFDEAGLAPIAIRAIQQLDARMRAAGI